MFILEYHKKMKMLCMFDGRTLHNRTVIVFTCSARCVIVLRMGEA